ncbi:MAG: hypothetical protein KKG75_03290 [Nanoarchaeota archaeon]|nr:hypothetical protein [Nanoarchaeota archaeon]
MKISNKEGIIVLAVAFALVILLSNIMTGYVSKSYIDKGRYLIGGGNSQCDKVGGMALIIGGQEQEKYGKMIKVYSVSDDVTLISVDGAKRTMEPGHEKYVAGLWVTVYSTGTKDACLIVKNWEG